MLLQPSLQILCRLGFLIFVCLTSWSHCAELHLWNLLWNNFMQFIQIFSQSLWDLSPSGQQYSWELNFLQKYFLIISPRGWTMRSKVLPMDIKGWQNENMSDQCIKHLKTELIPCGLWSNHRGGHLVVSLLVELGDPSNILASERQIGHQTTNIFSQAVHDFFFRVKCYPQFAGNSGHLPLQVLHQFIQMLFCVDLNQRPLVYPCVLLFLV